ncbi:MAG: SEL1-like repeat protein, partial [Thermoguttaceae bacterium]|nr:SEL1-like repeat protein [Thermoguttaceae bacterium]
KKRFQGPLNVKGNDFWGVGKITSLSELRDGYAYGEAEIAAAAGRIRTAYQKKFFSDVRVTPRVEPVEGSPNAVSITMEIEEGPRVKIRDFTFKGVEGVEASDLREAFEQYRKAASQRLPQAQTHVGECFEEGIGRPQDSYQAFYWYRKAAKNKDPEGMSRLGRSYFLGVGVARDERKAAKWFKRAADAGLSSAQVLMGKSLLSGSGTQVDRSEAFRYFKRAAVKGDPDGIYNLAFCYEHGLGAPKDPDRAMELYRHAARLGSSEAARRLK